MTDGIYLITLVGTLLVLAAAFSSLVAHRFGAPLLLVFLLIGLLTGVDGLGINFDNAPLAYFVGSMALAVILFDSGFGTSLTAFRQAAGPAISLASFGVIITAGVFSLAAFVLTPFGWLESLLLGAIVGSTDAAAVFFLLRAGNVSLRDRVRSTLEVESGSNDPMAAFLTIALVELIAAGTEAGAGAIASEIAVGFTLQMGLGLLIGLAGGYAIARLVERLNLDRALMPIFVLALSLLVFAAAGASGGSGFLAVYVAGLIAGNSDIRATENIGRFQSGVTWLAQIIMFLVLGLFATPSQFAEIAVPAVVLGLFLIFFARPVAVAICLIPFRFPRAETAFVSWVGLRGAVSILLAITPMLGGLENGRAMFNTAFIIVLVSLVVQGWTIKPLARRLGQTVPPRIGPLNKFELELPGSAHHELLAYRVVEGSPVLSGTRLPRWARPSLVVRDGHSLVYQQAGRLQANDHVYIFVPRSYPRLLDRLFASRTELTHDDVEFFGAFTIDPDHSSGELADSYGLDLSPDDREKPISVLMTERLGGRAEYADRVTIGEVELIVRDIDENGHINAAGLSFEPQATTLHIPVFLSMGEAWDRLRATWSAWRARRAAARSGQEAATVGRETTARNWSWLKKLPIWRLRHRG